MITIGYFNLRSSAVVEDDQSSIYELRYLKQLGMYKRKLFELNEIYGIDSSICTKEEQW